MIRVLVDEVDGIINRIEMSGHADFSEVGSDIVCAAASSIAIVSLNLTEKFTNKIQTNEEDGYLEAIVSTDDEIVQTILINMVEHLTELSLDYEKNIKIIK